MLEPVGLDMHLVERQAERLREVLLEQPVMPDDLERDLLPRRGQLDTAVRGMVGEAEPQRAS